MNIPYQKGSIPPIVSYILAGIFMALIIAGAIIVRVYDFSSSQVEVNHGEPVVVATTSDSSVDWKTYTSPVNSHFTITHPAESVVNEKYTYTFLGPNTALSGVSFSLPKEFSQGTNLSENSYISVEVNEKMCGAKNLVSGALKEDTTEVINGVTYSKAISTDAGAGNFYSETVYATFAPWNKNVCYSFRLFLHSINIGIVQESRPEVKVYDEVKINKLFKEMVSSAVIDQSVSSEVSSSEPMPVITSISKTSGPIGSVIELRGANFSGFEGDKNVWIENVNLDIRGVISAEPDSTDTFIRFRLNDKYCTSDNSYSGIPCAEYLAVVPGAYSLYVRAWDKESNHVNFITTLSNSLPQQRVINKNDWGISFPLPLGWIVTNNVDSQIVLTENSSGDRITLDYTKSQIYTDIDTKFGNITYEFNNPDNTWYQVLGQTMTKATPEFYLENVIPVFIGTSRWKTYIVTPSDDVFIKINIIGSGNVEPLEKFVKSISITS